MPTVAPIRVQVRGQTKWQVSMPKRLAVAIGVPRKRFFFDSRADAQKKADELNDDLLGRAAEWSGLNLEQQSSVLRCLHRLGGDVNQLERAVDFFLTHDRPGEEKKLGEAIAICIKEKERTGKSRRYVKQLGYALASFSAGRRDMLCSEISTKEIEDWLHGNEWGPKTQKGNLIDLRTFLNFCIRREWLKRDPTKGIEPIILAPKPPQIFTPDQARDIMFAAQKHQPTLVPYFALAMFCGIRPAEIFRLRWPNIYVDRGFVEVESTKAKTKRRRLVTISENCKAWLKLKGDLPVIDFQDRFEDVRKRAGFVDNWPQNAMRHSFCSYHLAMHQNAALTASEAGHSQDQLFRDYRELVTKADAEKFWGIYPAVSQ